MIRIMIVDDDDDIRFLLRSVFVMSKDFHVVAEASNGDEAISVAKEALPDLILLDILMPRMDGLTAFPILKTASPNSKIVMITGVLSSQLVSEDRGIGFFEAAIKPDGIIPKTVLLQSIDKLREIVKGD